MGVIVRGVSATAFARKSGRAASALAAEAVNAALADAGIGWDAVDAVWFGSAAAHHRRPPTVAGPSILGVEGIPVHQVEAACATGGAAVHGACAALLAGLARTAVVVGVDTPDVPDVTGLLDGAIVPDPADGGAWAAARARADGVGWDPVPGLPIQLEISALAARQAVARGLPREALAAVAAKARAAGAANPRAWLRRPVSAAEVAAEPDLVAPLSRSMLCGLVDGAAALVLSVDGDGVALAGIAAGAGRRAPLGEPPPSGALARRALAGARPDVIELHDATAYAELATLDAAGWFDGGAVAATLAGETAPDGSLPVNPSGGLLARGHALAATGVVQVVEVVRWLRARGGVGVCVNGGGLIGVQDALCVASAWRA